ncbi:hypothetical protein ACIBHX_19730 [Nonomuraea sp. NPDC050536]
MTTSAPTGTSRPHSAMAARGSATSLLENSSLDHAVMSSRV